METFLKKPYELSIWEDRQYYVYEENGVRKEGQEVPSGATIKNDYLKEEKIAVVGGDSLDTPIKVINPKLTEKINGEHILTFQISSKYFDDGELKWNPFYQLLCNEQKIKLHYEDRWFDFSIKTVEENSTQYIYNYTCAEIITETLGKTGYEVELSEDYGNNMGSINYLAEQVMDSSEWRVAPAHGETITTLTGETIGSEVIKQYANEALFIYANSAALPCTVLEDFSRINSDGTEQTWTKGRSYTVPANSAIYIFYSDLLNEVPQKQFFWVNSSVGYVTDEDGNIINSPHYVLTNPLNITVNDLRVSETYRGDKLVIKQITEYLPKIDKYCPIYTKNNVKYYCLEGTEYTSGINVQQLLTNNVDMTSTRGWFVQDGGTTTFSITKDGYLQANMKANTQAMVDTGDFKNALCNSGVYDNRVVFKDGIAPGDTFVLKIEYNTSAKVNRAAVCAKGVNIDYWFNFTSYTNSGNTQVFTYTVPDTSDHNGAISYQDILKLTNFYFCLYRTTNAEVVIKKVQFFKQVLDEQGNVIEPDQYENDGEKLYSEIIRPIYNVFTETQYEAAESLDDLKYYHRYYNELPNTYAPVMSEDSEKIRSISVKQSNRFNIIQKLCETFECWVKFVVNYSDEGKIIYGYKKTEDTEAVKGKRYYNYALSGTKPNSVQFSDKNFDLVDPGNNNPKSKGYYEKIYDKYIQFLNYITTDNYAGFRRSINLKSINRKIVSNNITTKLIVEQNSNEMAEPFGSCDIQTSSLNTYGETALYNFDYYINQGILERGPIYSDLYGDAASGGMSFLIKLGEINKTNNSKISALTELSNTLVKAEAKLQVANASLGEAELQYSDNIQYLTDAGYSNPNIETIVSNRENYPDVIYTYAKKASEALLSKAKYDPIVDQVSAAVDAYKADIEDLQEELAENRKEKDALIREFNSKYGRYIREGSWIDESYMDADLYYLDGLGVLYNSAFPKIEYNIGVIDLSQLEEYKGYTFKVGDKTYIEDVEFFGYLDNKKTPYKKEIVVTEVNWNLDDPSSNTITVKTYKDEFESLFQRITAASQSLQYSEGGYARAAAAIKPEGILDSALMQRSLSENQATISNIKDQTVTWDASGITISSLYEPENIVKLVNRGIVMSEDGGKNWTTGVTASGINASMITTGVLDADLIRIYNGSQPSFVWDGNGLNAYYQPTDGRIENSRYVTFNGSGIVGQINTSSVPVFKLDWNGLELNAVNNNNYLKLSTNGVTEDQKKKIIYAGSGSTDKFVVYNDGSIKATDGEFTGTVHATSGEFTGTIKASDVLLKNGNSWESILDGNKIKNNYLDLGNIQIDGNNTTITLGNGGTITLGTGVNALTISTNGISFGSGAGFSNVAFTGKYSDLTGKPSIPVVPSYIKSTYIGETEIYTPTIYGGTIYAVNNEGDPGAYYAKITGDGFSVHRSSNNAICALITHSGVGSIGKIQGPYGLQIDGGTGRLLLSGAYLVLSSSAYGSTLPSSSGALEGQIYFVI